MDAEVLTYMLLQSLSEKDLSNEQIKISFMPVSNRYGSAIFENKLTKQVYHCKFVATESKCRITVVMANGESWFGAEGHRVATRLLSCPSTQLQGLTVVGN
jgi:hypothetical protein